jgi:hypothetical protein
MRDEIIRENPIEYLLRTQRLEPMGGSEAQTMSIAVKQ